jgi:hypothetical protein
MRDWPELTSCCSAATTRTSPARQVPAADRAVDQVLDQEAADAAPPVPKAVSPVSAVAEPALPAAAEEAPVPLVAQDPDTRAPRQVCYRWHSPSNSVSSFQATANDHNREKTAQEFAETSRCASCPAPRETLARDQGIQHSHSQRLRGALPRHEQAPSQDAPSSPEPHKAISCGTQATSIKSLPHLAARDAFHILGLATEALAGPGRQEL